MFDICSRAFGLDVTTGAGFLFQQSSVLLLLLLLPFKSSKICKAAFLLENGACFLKTNLFRQSNWREGKLTLGSDSL